MPKIVYLQRSLSHYFIQKKSAAEAHRLLVETYGNQAILETTYRDWFRHFKNNDFDVIERSGSLKKFEDEEVDPLLHKDTCQAQTELAESLGVDHTTVVKRLKAFGMIQKVSYELNPRDVERRLVTRDQLLKRQKWKGYFAL